MAQPPHFNIDGVIYFVTTRLKDKGLMLTEYEAEIVQKTILDLSDWENKACLTHNSDILPSGRGDFNHPSKTREIVLYAYVIMPDHMHVLLKPINNEDREAKASPTHIGGITPQGREDREAKASPIHIGGIISQGRGDFSRPSGISKVMQLIKGRASRQINKGNFWQKGFF